MLALVKGEPVVLGLKELITEHINHRKIVITRRTQYDLQEAEKKVHLLEGLLIALNNIDDVVAGIKKSKTIEEARSFLILTYVLTEEQAKAILEMRLQKLAALEQEKIRAEHQELLEKIHQYKEILSSEAKILVLIKEEVEELQQNHADERRSRIIPTEDDEVDIEELIEESTVVVTVTSSGYVKRLPLDTYKTQKRGGKGVIATGMKDEDFVERLYINSTHDYLLIFTDKGQVYWLKVYQIPEGSRQSKGKHIANLLEMQTDERINAIIPVGDFHEGYLFMATKQGTVKKTELQEFSNPRRGGIRAINLNSDDSLVGVKYTTGNDESIGTLAAEEGLNILTITTKGYGQRTPVSAYRLCNRGGKGVTNIKITDK